jgi:hypothetical protein
MEEAPSRMFTWSFAVTLAAIGGFAAAVGVLLGWWDAEAYRTSEIFGNEQVESPVLLGTAHWSGTVAPVLGSLGGVLVMGAAAIGFAQATGVAEAQVGGTGLSVDAFVVGGLILSAGGGFVAALGGFLALRTAEA